MAVPATKSVQARSGRLLPSFQLDRTKQGEHKQGRQRRAGIAGLRNPSEIDDGNLQI